MFTEITNPHPSSFYIIIKKNIFSELQLLYAYSDIIYGGEIYSSNITYETQGMLFLSGLVRSLY